jgi:hypothetical protein
MRGIDWIDLAQDSDRWRAGSCEYGDETSCCIEYGEFLE